jgi:hypothetical protein
MNARPGKYRLACMGLLALLFCFGSTAQAGIDESIVKEIMNIQRELDSLPAQRRAEVQRRMGELEQEAARAPPGSEVHTRIRREIVALQKELESLPQVATRHFPGVRNKLAVFTFEDPAQTGLGDAVSFIASKSLLFHTPVRSLAIVNFQQGLTPDSTGLSYFEKVDRIVVDQGYLASLWGEIGNAGDDYVIETYVQLHAAADSSRLHAKLEAPGLSSPLRGSLQSNRLWLQTKVMSRDALKQLQSVAQQIRKLRATPDAAAEQTGELSEGVQYWINDRRGDWIQLETKDGKRGWTSVRQFCQGDCRAITDAADFVSQLAVYVNAGSWSGTFEGFRPSVAAFNEQVSLLQALNGNKDLRSAVSRAKEWSASGGRPGGAALANLTALGELQLLSTAGQLDRDAAGRVANHLAKAVLADPGNLDALFNLRVLFEYVGDEKRAGLARNLFDERAARAAAAN